MLPGRSLQRVGRECTPSRSGWRALRRQLPLRPCLWLRLVVRKCPLHRFFGQALGRPRVARGVNGPLGRRDGPFRAFALRGRQTPVWAGLHSRAASFNARAFTAPAGPRLSRLYRCCAPSLLGRAPRARRLLPRPAL